MRSEPGRSGPERSGPERSGPERSDPGRSEPNTFFLVSFLDPHFFGSPTKFACPRFGKYHGKDLAFRGPLFQKGKGRQARVLSSREISSGCDFVAFVIGFSSLFYVGVF